MALTFKIINFLIFIGLLYFFVRKPARDFLIQRHNSISTIISSAKKAFATARDEEARSRESLKGLDAEIGRISKDLRNDGELEKKKIVEQASRYADQIVNDAASFSKNETSRATQEIKDAAAEEMISMVAVRLSKEMTSVDQLNVSERAAREISENL